MSAINSFAASLAIGSLAGKIGGIYWSGSYVRTETEEAKMKASALPIACTVLGAFGLSALNSARLALSRLNECRLEEIQCSGAEHVKITLMALPLLCMICCYKIATTPLAETSKMPSRV